MKSLKQTLFYLFITTLFNISCNRIEKNINNFQKNIEDMNIAPSQSFSINPFRDTVLKGVKGTRIIIPKLAFCDSNEKVVYSEIKIELREFYKLSDILFSKLNTISNGQIIETGGMIYMKARNEKKELKIVSAKKITIEFMSNFNSEMNLFSGEKDSLGNINWISQNKEKTIDETPRVDTIPYSHKLHNVLTTTSLGWINCDKFLSFPKTTEIFVKNQDVIDSNVFCGLILKKYNSIIPATFTIKNNVKFTPVPLDEKVTIILISFNENQYFFGSKDEIVNKNMIYDIVMQPISKEELTKKISELDKQRALF